MSTPNQLDLANDPDGLKAAIQTSFEAARNVGDTINDGTDRLSVSPSTPGTPVAPSVSDLDEDFPLATADSTRSANS